MELLELLETYPGYVDATDPTDEVLRDWCYDQVVVAQDITYQDLLFGWAEPENTRFKLADAFVVHETTPWANSVYNSMLIMRDAFESGADLALSRDDVRQTINTLSGPGLPFSAANRVALYALADGLADRAAAEGITAYNRGDIEQARAV